ncbi:putative adhesin [Endozoicomonas lisbonensis]|uniref:Putative adhesin Stv domain-containing protein n=1 Tax=Endozoicomonas lisbonensis TaxID=3120522 RepID=A0ABV2SF60_9GAMM
MKFPTRSRVKTEKLKSCLKLYTCKNLGDNIQNLIISCHGLFESKCDGSMEPSSHFYTPNWTTLFFYGPHGTPLLGAPHLYMQGSAPPLEAALPQEKVVNYLLLHKSGSSWGDIPDLKEVMVKYRTGEYRTLSQHPFRFYDVVTLEPCEGYYLRLKTVLNILFKTGHCYPRIHCDFCRSRYGDTSLEHLTWPSYRNRPGPGPEDQYTPARQTPGLLDDWVIL